MSPNRARALVAHVQLLSWNASADRLLQDAAVELTRALEPITPRRTVVAPGQWWLEPAEPKRGGTSGERRVEEAFAARTLACVEAAGFPGARIGIADGPIAATAATRVGGYAMQWIAPGEDSRYLSGLPVTALPLGSRTLRLLGDLGIDTVGTLQAMPAQALEGRFGLEGRRAWQIGQGHDPRRPRAPGPDVTARIVLPLLEGCEETEPLLFVLRPALEQLVEAQAQTGRAVACLGLTFERAWGPPLEVILTPLRPLSDPRLLLELVRLRLHEDSPCNPTHGPIVTLVLEALRTTPRQPRQADLFTASTRTSGDAEEALARLTGHLGADAIQTPILRDERRPEQTGGWQPLNQEAPHPPATHPHVDVAACLRLLPSPRALDDEHTRPEQIRLGRQLLHTTTWHGPERLSGHWWCDAYDRDYYWVSTREGRALWLFRARTSGRWFLHGWLD